LSCPALQAGPCHALAQAAVFQEILFEPAEPLVEEVVRLVDQADRDVGPTLTDGVARTTFSLARRGSLGAPES
jgi:hypothetical protein